MNIGAAVNGQHSEYGWPKAGEWSVLVLRNDGRLRDVGQFATMGEAVNFADSFQAQTVVVRFHTAEWAGLLDGSLTIDQYSVSNAA